MSMVWVFLVLTSGHMVEVGGFPDEDTCNNTREQVIVQREAIGFGPKYKDTNNFLKPYVLTSQFETTKCFRVWKR